MTAAHFATALAIKSRVPRSSTTLVIIGAFIPDSIWIALATRGVEPTDRRIFFDDWSHSLLSVLVCAGVWAWLFRSQGKAVTAAMGAAVLSHFALDMPIHPKPLALFPHSRFHFDLGVGSVSNIAYWWVQLAVVLALLAIYVAGRRRVGIPDSWAAATCTLVLGWHVVLLPG